mgnify:FL=1
MNMNGTVTVTIQRTFNGDPSGPPRKHSISGSRSLARIIGDRTGWGARVYVTTTDDARRLGAYETAANGWVINTPELTTAIEIQEAAS